MTVKIPKLTLRQFGSVADMLADSQAVCTLPANESVRHKHMVTRESNVSWHGIIGGPAACVAALRDGVPLVEKRIAELLPTLQASLPRALGHNRAKMRGEAGDELDIHAVNMGRTDKAWSKSARRIKIGSGIIRLCVDIGGNSSQSADRLAWRGIAACLLTQVMEKAGYSVEITAAQAVAGHFMNHGPQYKMASSVVVKGRQGKADIGLLSATVCLPGFFRTLCFAQIVKSCDVHSEPVDYNLGSYTDVSGLLPAESKVTTLFVPSDVVSQESALKWVRQSVQLLQHSTIDKEGR